MRVTAYKCDRCHRLIEKNAYSIALTDEQGNDAAGTLLENIDLCGVCAREVADGIAAMVERGEETEAGTQEIGRSEEITVGQQDEEQEQRQQGQNTYQCSKVMGSCAYADRIGAAMICNYIGIEGRRRGCEPEECNKYKRIVKKRGRKAKVQKPFADVAIEAES